MEEAQQEFGFCALCGFRGDYDSHLEGPRHQRAGANMALRIIARGFCPWPHQGKLVGLPKCRIKLHREWRKLAEKRAGDLNEFPKE